MFNLKEINNSLLDTLIENYIKEETTELKTTIFDEIMNTWFIIPILKADENTNTYDVEWVKDYQDKLYVPIFTSYANFLKCKTLKSKKVMICDFKLILKMYEGIEENIYNIVINPYGFELNISKADIAKFRISYTMDIFRFDLVHMEVLDLPKNNVTTNKVGTKINEINMPFLFKKEVTTIASFHKDVEKVYVIGRFDKKVCKNKFDIVFKVKNGYKEEELHFDEIQTILYEYLDKKTNEINVINYREYKNKRELSKIEPFWKRAKEQ